MQSFQNLLVWQKAHALALHVYKVSDHLPPSESFGLALNLRRAAVAVPRAIAEGVGRGHSHEFSVDLRKARAATNELEYLFLLCRDLNLLSEPQHDELRDEVHEVGKMISGLLSKVAAPEPVR